MDSAENRLPVQEYHTKYRKFLKLTCIVFVHIIPILFFAYATFYFISSETKNASNEIINGRCFGRCSFQWCDGYGMFLILFIMTYLGILYFKVLKPHYGASFYAATGTVKRKILHVIDIRIARIALCTCILAAIATFLYFEMSDSVDKLQGLSTPLIFLVIGFLVSKDRKAIRWRTVLTGLLLQFLLGVVCIRWEVGRKIFICLGDKMSAFLSYANDGCVFVFGEEIVNKQNVFAFSILPIIYFFGFTISILYHLGAMQFAIMKIGWFLQQCIGTTVCESVNATANIFLGLTESPLLIKPYIRLLTASEIHTVMVSGFATVAGSGLAAYISYGAKAEHLITSCVMAAPASLAWSKLYLPETEETLTNAKNIQLEKSQSTSILEAASAGMTDAIQMVLGVVANVVAFVAFVAFLNGIFGWLGYLVGVNDLTFEFVFGKMFMPLAWTLGVPWSECEYVGQIIATKSIINEFVAYERLGHLKTILTARSYGIATFAICGFSNPGSVGIMISALNALAPQSREKISSVAFRAYIVGSLVCWVSASFAGFLMPSEQFDLLNGV